MDDIERHERWLIDLDNSVKALEASDLSNRLFDLETEVQDLRKIVNSLVESIRSMDTDKPETTEPRQAYYRSSKYYEEYEDA